jgi:hypothetical protein
MKRGDILVFHANMHHRGINFNKTPHRRLLQVFEVFPDNATYNTYAPNVLIVQTSKNSIIKNVVNPLMYQLSKSTTLIDTLNFCHYLFMNNDVHYKLGLMDIEPWHKRGKYISYEPGRRVRLSDMQYEDLNVNILCDTAIQSRKTSNYYLYWFLLMVIAYLVYKYMKPKKRRYAQ